MIFNEGSKPEMMAMIAQTAAILSSCKPFGKTSVFLYACKTWTLNSDIQSSILTTEMKCLKKRPCNKQKRSLKYSKTGNQTP